MCLKYISMRIPTGRYNKSYNPLSPITLSISWRSSSSVYFRGIRLIISVVRVSSPVPIRLMSSMSIKFGDAAVVDDNKLKDTLGFESPCLIPLDKEIE